MSFFKSDEDEPEQEREEATGSPRTAPLLPLRDIVVFPHMVVPLFVGRAKSIRALEEATNGDRQLLLAAQCEATEDDPGEDDVYRIGTMGTIIQLLRLPDGTVKVLVEGKSRAKIKRFIQSEPHFACELDVLEEPRDAAEAAYSGADLLLVSDGELPEPPLDAPTHARLRRLQATSGLRVSPYLSISPPVSLYLAICRHISPYLAISP